MATRLSLTQAQKTRDKIAISQIVQRLNKHALGKVDMTPTQIKAAEILLRKVLPDVQAISYDVSGTITHAAELTDGALLAYLNEQRAIANQANSPALTADIVDAEYTEMHCEPVRAPSRHDDPVPATTTPTTPRKRRERPSTRLTKIDLSGE